MTSSEVTPPSWRILTPSSAPGALAAIELQGPMEAIADILGWPPPPLGAFALRDILGVDRGIAARFDRDAIVLMPHGGLGVVRAIVRALSERGLGASNDESCSFPEARDEIERRALAAIARAASPLAIDLLLDQPRRWRGLDPAAASTPGLADDRVLRRLIDPPLVVAIGPTNVGKSTLANALAGRAVSIVADEPGTTRDHVGFMLDVGGLVVRYVDCPGIRDGPGIPEAEASAVGLALRLAAGADLLLLLGDAAAAPPALAPPGVQVLRVGLRADLGRPAWDSDVVLSARELGAVAALVGEVRRVLLPDAALADPRPWRFWPLPRAHTPGTLAPTIPTDPERSP